MRLHRLGVTAFGPFAGSEEVDFDALSTAGLFLFTGATGAGKTSLLDAVCFALYGQVPGARQQARALRSDHSPDHVRPEVTLEATLRGRRLRVTRSPAWDRPKRRGTGTVLENARLLVQEDGPDGRRTLATRLDEGGQLLRDLAGLSLAQFCQVVLLPQGQFAEFLRSDADRRRDLLESLFDTRRFASVEAWLVARRQQAGRALEEADRALAGVLARVAQAAGVEPPEDAPQGATDWVDRLLADARADARAATRAAGSAAEQAAAAAAAAAAAHQDAAQRRRHAALQRRRAGLEAAQPAVDAAVAELQAARAVAPLVPVLAEVGRLQGELESARLAAGAATVALAAEAPVLAATGTESGTASPPARIVRDVSRRTREEAAALGPLVDQEQEAAELERAAETLRVLAVEAATLAGKADAWLEGAAGRRAELEARRDAARAAAGQLPTAQAAVEVTAARLDAGRRRDRLVLELTTAADALRAATDAHQGARDALQDLRAARLRGMAAELAAPLTPGQACPVCGSAEHPSPAVAVEGRVTAEDEDAARRAEAAAASARGAASDRVAALEVATAEARARAGGDAGVPVLERAHATATATADRAAEVAAGLAQAQQALDAFDTERDTWARDQVARHAEASRLADRRAEQQARVAALLAAVTVAQGDDPSVSARADRLHRLATDLEQLSGRLADVERLDAAVAAALDRVESEVRARDLGSVAAVSEAARGDDRLAELEDVRRHHEAALASVSDQLADPELAAVMARAPADHATLDEVARTTAVERDDAVARAAGASTRASALTALRDQLVATLARRAPLAELHRSVDALSRLAEGKSADNSMRMSLSAYVLAARLEQVAESASHRLLRMTSGRYTLLHSPAAGAGRGRGGLALRVLDAWTGLERDPASLSGGESFAASLALALGLADVVTAEAGGALLETLFVDEGFGSLDDETLDDVMGVLDDLRDGGRTVGLVSHVADLRQRIPVQLRVEKGRRGSVVRHVAGH